MTFSTPRHVRALGVVCLGVIMMVLDMTITTVALPSIRADLGFSDSSATWVLNAYMLGFGGFLLLSGRLADLYGGKRLFLFGIGVFTLASLACGLSPSRSFLLIARAVQGLGAAVVSAVSLSLVLALFTDSVERVSAIAVYSLVRAVGSGIGELVGGILTQDFGWRWIFLVNIPIGATVYVFCRVLLPRDTPTMSSTRLEVTGSVLITCAATLLVYTLVDITPRDQGLTELDWALPHRAVLISGVLLFLAAFLTTERLRPDPLIPLRMFQLRNFVIANILGVSWAAGTLAWFVLCALYLQGILGYDPFHVGLAFAPAEAIMVAFSARLSSIVMAHCGPARPLFIGLLLSAAGLAWFARAPLVGSFLPDVLPGMLLLGLGAGVASAPLLVVAISDVGESDTGLASGMINTSYTIGGAIGLATLSSLAATRVHELRESGVDALHALNSGYHLAFLTAAALVAIPAIVGTLALSKSGLTFPKKRSA